MLPWPTLNVKGCNKAQGMTRTDRVIAWPCSVIQLGEDQDLSVAAQINVPLKLVTWGVQKPYPSQSCSRFPSWPLALENSSMFPLLSGFESFWIPDLRDQSPSRIPDIDAHVACWTCNFADSSAKEMTITRHAHEISLPTPVNHSKTLTSPSTGEKIAIAFALPLVDFNRHVLATSLDSLWITL